MNRETLLREHPGLFLLDPADLTGLQRYLAGQALVEAGEKIVAASRAGEGNMNCTVRVTTTRRRFIVKQARPWVEKYEHIEAPWDRSLVEAAFYRVASSCVAASAMPRLLGSDPRARVLVLEDLGEEGDYTTIYAGARLASAELARLAEYLRRLHACPIPTHEVGLFENREMRALNHEHMFLFPLRQANGLALDEITPGLSGLAEEVRADRPFVDRVHALGERYLTNGTRLVHGDYFPGSWLHVPGGIAVIDPEFCFLGAAEFDAGVLLAHLLLAEQPGDLVEQHAALFARDYDGALLRQFAGVEIMRRLIGVAQLPLPASIERKRALQERSRELVLGG